MIDIFISYCRRNKEFVQRLYNRLTQEERTVWVDWQDIPPNADWRNEIAEGIQQSTTVLFVLSPDWMASYECRVELEQAVKLNKRLLPIVCQDVQYKDVDPALASLNWIFFREMDDFDRAYQALTQALETDLAYVKTHTRLLNRAMEWDKKERDPSFLLRGQQFAEAEQWLKLSGTKKPEPLPLQVEYIISSGQSQSKRQKGTILAVGIALVIASGLALFATVQYNVAEHERRESEELQVLTLSKTALDTFDTHNQLDGLLASVKANMLLRSLPWLSQDDPLYQSTEDNLRQLFNEVHEENRMEGHLDLITNLRVSPDGETIASTSADNTVKLWSRDGQLITTLLGHTSTVWSVMFSSDGQMLATTSEDGTLRLWNIDGTPIRTIELDAPVLSISFSPIDDVMAVATSDETIRIIRLDGTLVNSWNMDQGKVFSIRFSPDGQTILSGSADKIARLWDLQGNLLQSFVGHAGEIWAVRFSPDGSRVATASADNTVKLWDLQGKLLQTFIGHASGVISLSFSPDSQLLASASADHTVRVWSMDGVMLSTFYHADIVAGVDFIDNQTLASGSYDKTVRIWHIEGNGQQNLLGHQRRILSLAVSGDSQLIASGSTDQTVKLWQLEGDRFSLLSTISLPNDGEPNGVSLDQTGDLVAIASSDGFVYFYSRTGELLHRLSGGGLEALSVAISPDGQEIATGHSDTLIRVWNRDGELLRTLKGHDEGVRTLAFSSNGQFLASGGQDNTIRLWNRAGSVLRVMHGHAAGVFSVAFLPDSTRLVSGSTDNTVKLWNTDGDMLLTIPAHDSGVTSVGFSADGKMIASGSFDNTVRLWSLDGVLLQTLTSHQQRIAALSFSPDGRWLITGSADKLVKVWNLADVSPVPLDQGQLIQESCYWLQHYLDSNPNVATGDRSLCDYF
jgi:WD40 repeat protein